MTDAKDSKFMMQSLEGNMNYILRKFEEGKIKPEHMSDIVKRWAMCYKQSILCDLAHKVIKSEDPERYVLEIPMMTLHIIPELLKGSEQLDNLMDELIEGRKDDKSSSVQNQG